MQHILVYGDSLSWGIIPGSRKRLQFGERWPGVLEHGLLQQGQAVRITEDCLNGRRTVWEDPFKPGRNGLQGLGQRIESCSPLALVMLFLGTNDFQSMHQLNPWHAAQGITALVNAIRQAPIEPGMAIPSVLIIAPPAIGQAYGQIAPKFQGAAAKCKGLSQAYQEAATTLGCQFFDASQVVQASPVDGVHLDAAQHLALGKALVRVVDGLL